MHRIFLIPELLVPIISFLPPDTLQACFLISRYWNHTLKKSLPPQSKQLPDSPCSHHDSISTTCSSFPLQARTRLSRNTNRNHNPLPPSITLLAREIAAQDTQWRARHILGDISDDYYFWQESAKKTLLKEIAPHLHPLIRDTAVEFTGGLDEVGRGEMAVVLRTRSTGRTRRESMKSCLTPTRALEVFDGIEKGCEWAAAYLTSPPVSSVEVYCIKGAEWDLSYANLLRRGGGYVWERTCVRVEREKGVRLGDVVAEMSGLLMSSHTGTPSETEDGSGDVLLEWRFGGPVVRPSVQKTIGT